MTVSDCLIPLILFLILSLIFVASYTTPFEWSSIDKNCKEQLVLYLLDHIVEIVNTFAWLWIRFYIVYRTASLVMDDLMKPIAICLAKKAYR
ncbi:hypothetical protein N7501_001243 [Penicillium viridicatum]|nr:hypothetical protein N7501_001243 [Penicillium viridicatum]